MVFCFLWVLVFLLSFINTSVFFHRLFWSGILGVPGIVYIFLIQDFKGSSRKITVFNKFGYPLFKIFLDFTRDVFLYFKFRYNFSLSWYPGNPILWRFKMIFSFLEILPRIFEPFIIIRMDFS